jgi:hypothetical protein
MSELSKPGAPNVLPDFSTPLAQAGSDIARRFYEQSQVITDTVTALNGEICQFISHRLVRDGEAVGSMTKCQSLPDIVAIQSKWFQDAADDYLNEMGKLMGRQ